MNEWNEYKSKSARLIATQNDARRKLHELRGSQWNDKQDIGYHARAALPSTVGHNLLANIPSTQPINYKHLLKKKSL